MKGLLLQDIYLMKKNILICFCFMIFMLVILFAMNTNLPGAEIVSSVEASLYIIALLFPTLCTSCIYFTMNNDKSSCMYMYMSSYPVSPSSIALAKYILVFASILLNIIVMGGFILTLYILNGYTPNKNIICILFLIFSVEFLFNCIELPVSMRFGPAVASGVLVVVIILASFALFTFVIKSAEANIELDIFALLQKHRAALVSIVAIFDVAIGWLSYQVAKRI